MLKIVKIFSVMICALIMGNLFAVSPFVATASVEENFIYDLENDCCIITGFTGEYSIIEIPNNIDGHPVTSIANDAFVNNKSITSVLLPESITSIGDSAFFGCTNLESINIPPGVKTIESNTFNRCESLTNIAIPENVTSIGTGAFLNCKKLINIDSHSGFHDVGHNAFGNTAWLDSQEDGFVYIGNVLYCYKGNMPENETLVLSKDITCIAACAMYDQTNLSSFTFHDGVANIGWGAFHNTGIKSLDLPSVSEIEYDTFADCKSLTQVIIPDTVTYICNSAFEGCSALTEVNFQDVTDCYISISAFADCSVLTNVTIPSGVTGINQWAFGYLYSETDGCEVLIYPIDNFTIYGYTSTAAETYANENDFTFIALDDDPDTTTTTTDVTTTTTETTTDSTETTTETTTTSDEESTATTTKSETTSLTSDTTTEINSATTTITTTVVTTDEIETANSIENITVTTETTTTAITHIASDDELCDWAVKDYEEKTGVKPANAEIEYTADDTAIITLIDAEGNVLDVYTIDPTTGTGTESDGGEVNLPQTGYSKWYHTTAALAACVTVIGGVMVIGSGVLKKKR